MQLIEEEEILGLDLVELGLPVTRLNEQLLLPVHHQVSVSLSLKSLS